MRKTIFSLLLACGPAPRGLAMHLLLAPSLDISEVKAFEVFVIAAPTTTGEVLSCSGIGATAVQSIDGANLLAYALATQAGGTIQLDSVDATHEVVIVADAFAEADAVGAPIGRACQDSVTLKANSVNHLSLTLAPLP